LQKAKRIIVLLKFGNRLKTNMNKFFYLFVAIFSFACSSKKDESKQSDIDQKPIEQLVIKDAARLIPERHGIESWYSILYMDSTIDQKSIHKYAYSCASYAYKIIVDRSKMDSAEFIGYHESWKDKLEKKDSNIYWMGDETQYWEIKFVDDFLTMQEFYKDNNYVVNYFLKREIEYSSLEDYFSKRIIAGNYLDTLTGKQFSFNNDLTITGIDSLIGFSLLIDFWEMVPQMDVIYLNQKNGNYLEYSWVFNDNFLQLWNFEPPYEADIGWVEAKIIGEPIILKKI